MKLQSRFDEVSSQASTQVNGVLEVLGTEAMASVASTVS